MSKRASKLPPLLPPSDSDAQCAGRHLCMLAVTARPDLWPTLNDATLNPPIDWAGTLRLLEAAAKRIAMLLWAWVAATWDW